MAKEFRRTYLKILLVLSVVFLSLFVITRTIGKYNDVRNINNMNINIDYEEGVYASLYDTDNDDIGDYLVLNNYPILNNHEQYGKLITNYNNVDNKNKSIDVVWHNDLNNIKIVDLKNKIKPNRTDLWFYYENYSSIEKVLHAENFNFSNVKTVEGMFMLCDKLNDIDVSNWNLSSVENFLNLFVECRSLINLDVSNWDVSNGKNLRGIFYHCEKLNNIDVSKWNTSSATNMTALFQGMYSIEYIDVSNFDTSNVTEMIAIFHECYKLKELDLSSWNTSKVTQMRAMFLWDRELTTIYASELFVHDSVTDFNLDSVFYDCVKLVGGNGTKYDNTKYHEEYMNLDLHHQKGYFTSKNKYNITYELQGSKISNNAWHHYFTEDLDYTLETPIKDKYQFLGWSESKNIFNKLWFDYKEKYVLSGFYRILLDVEPNTQYTISTNYPARSDDNGAYLFVRSTDNIADPSHGSNGSLIWSTAKDGVKAGKSLTITSTSNGKLLFGILKGSETSYKENIQYYQDFLNGKYWVQIERGNKATSYSPYSEELNKNIIIKSGSSGNKSFLANWIKNPDRRDSTEYTNKRELTGADASYGVKEFEYYYSTSVISNTQLITPIGKTQKDINFPADGNYYLVYRTIDNAGNISDWCEPEYVRVDVTNPEADFRVEHKDGKHYIVIDTLDTLSDIKGVQEKSTNTWATNREVPLKIWVVDIYNRPSNATLHFPYAQWLKDLGYNNYHIETRYPTIDELKQGNYNTVVDDESVWSINTSIVNSYFNAGINLITIGNDTTSALDIIQSSTLTSVGTAATFNKVTNNLFTRRLGKQNVNTTDSRQAIKFIPEVEVFFNEIHTVSGNTYDAIGYWNKNGVNWIHSQVDYNRKTNTLHAFVGGSLHWISKKPIYYYEVTKAGTYTFDIIDNAGNVITKSYTYTG